MRERLTRPRARGLNHPSPRVNKAGAVPVAVHPSSTYHWQREHLASRLSKQQAGRDRDGWDRMAIFRAYAKVLEPMTRQCGCEKQACEHARAAGAIARRRAAANAAACTNDGPAAAGFRDETSGGSPNFNVDPRTASDRGSDEVPCPRSSTRLDPQPASSSEQNLFTRTRRAVAGQGTPVSPWPRSCLTARSSPGTRSPHLPRRHVGRSPGSQPSAPANRPAHAHDPGLVRKCASTETSSRRSARRTAAHAKSWPNSGKAAETHRYPVPVALLVATAELSRYIDQGGAAARRRARRQRRARPWEARPAHAGRRA